MRKRTKRVDLLILLTVLLSFIGPSSIATAGKELADDIWKSIDLAEIGANGSKGAKPWIRPDRFNAVRLEPLALDAVLAAAPMEFTMQAKQLPVVLTLPRPDGTLERFSVTESPVMHPDLEKNMADAGWRMKTYRGTSLDNPATTVGFDWGGPAGFHAMVYSPDGTYFIDPYWQGDTRIYTSYFKRDYTLRGKGKPLQCHVESDTAASLTAAASKQWTEAARNTSGVLRSYRMAVAGTGEYTIFHGGTAALAQAAVTTSVNRMNMLYERDFSVRLVLIANNMNLMYTDPGTDPYSQTSCNSTMLSENQANIDSVIGSANYDIGHVFGGSGGGGLAALPSVCNPSFKAQACTASPMPVGDPFDIDLAAHEVGHQFGGNHTWTGSDFNCTAGAFASSAAYEPGSGSTIQAYAGICGVDNIQNSADELFHRKSLDEMGTYMNGGGNCSTSGGIINPAEPVVNAGADFTIPIGTPFELTGSATDPDGDALTYNWEQFDLGLQKPLITGDDGVQPIFRTWLPATNPTRTFPRLNDLVAGALSPGETLPITDRTMNFRLTARDNRAGGGREGDDAMTVTSTTAAGPFALTAPNGGETIASGASQLVTWSPASTAGAPVNTPNVDILLSADGGLTYPTTLLASTPNDGSETITMPTDISTASGRIKIKGTGNIFFDISDTNFSLDALSQCQSPALALADPGTVTDQLTVVGSRTLADLNVTLDVSHTWVGDLVVSLEHDNSGTTVVLIDRPGLPEFPQGCFNDDIVADLDDEAIDPVEDQCALPTAISGIFTPNNPLSAFDGLDVASTWTLSVTDAFGGDTGTLNTWCIGGSFVPAAGCPANLILANQTLTGVQTLEATTDATLGPALNVDGTNIIVNAPTVIFTNGVQVSGTLAVGNTTSCT